MLEYSFGKVGAELRPCGADFFFPVDACALEVDKGKHVAIAGPNGSGWNDWFVSVFHFSDEAVLTMEILIDGEGIIVGSIELLKDGCNVGRTHATIFMLDVVKNFEWSFVLDVAVVVADLCDNRRGDGLLDVLEECGAISRVEDEVALLDLV